MTGQLKPLHLSAECLWSKYGFVDGSPFQYEDLGPDHDEDPPHPDWTLIVETMNPTQQADLLELLVRRHLLPAIASATGEVPEITRIHGHHNPVRDARLHHHNQNEVPAAWLDIGVNVTPDEVKQAAVDIMTRTS